MRDTVGEYMRTIIVVAMLGLFIWIIWGSGWLTGLGETAVPSDNNHEILASIEDREKPTITVNAPTIVLGDSIDLTKYVVATDADGNDITDKVEIFVDSFAFKDGVFTPIIYGTYTVRYRVKDSYNYSALCLYELQVLDNNS